jgi:hypothetical protein
MDNTKNLESYGVLTRPF